MFSSEYTWITLALLIVIGLILWKGLKPILAGLDARAERIRQELDEAQSLREEAQKLLAESKRRQRDAVEEAEHIVQHAREEAERMQANAEEALKDSLARREKLAMDKIAQAEATALAEVRSKAVDAAVDATSRLIKDNMDEGRASTVMSASIKEVTSKLA